MSTTVFLIHDKDRQSESDDDGNLEDERIYKKKKRTTAIKVFSWLCGLRDPLYWKSRQQETKTQKVDEEISSGGGGGGYLCGDVSPFFGYSTG